MQRHNKLKEQLHTNLLQSKANLYAARFQAQRQQREIEQEREATRRAKMSLTVTGIFSLLFLLIAFFAIRQWRKTQQRNRILAQQITEAVEYKDKYSKLKRSVETESSGGFAIRPQGDGDLKSPIQYRRITNPSELIGLYDIETTPLIFVLDNEKRIIAKKIQAKQIPLVL